MPDVTTGLQRRDLPGTLHTREAEDGAREVSGIGVPYNDPIELWGIREQFAPGAVQADETTMLFWRHADPIGLVVEHRDEGEDGWWHRSVISRTPAGDEAYTLARDGVVSRFSIGFEPIEHTETREDDGSITITHTKVRVREVSLVPMPAYDGARLTEVRHANPEPPAEKETPMPETLTVEDLTEVRTGLDDLSRTVELLRSDQRTEPDPVTQFRSFGEYVKGLATGDELATRAFEGAVVGDTIAEDSWIGSLVRIMRQKQTVARAFTYASNLPAEGMGVEYAKLESDTTDVAEQAAEGDDLVHGKVSITTDSARIKTFGGWSSLSRQAIERASIGILDTTFTALAMKYAKAIETYVRGVANTAATAAGTPSVQLGSARDADAWLAVLLDLAEKFDDNDRTLSGLFVSKDLFRSLANLETKDRLLKVTGTPEQGTLGTLTVSSVSADLVGIPVRVFPGWTGDKALAYDPFAIKTMESPGAPLRLQDENIVNLTKSFSVYGYATSFVQDVNALAKLTFAAA